jgi:hypothetical protein
MARTKTRTRLLRLVARYPRWTAQKFADKLDVSRTRVYQILWAAGFRQEWRRSDENGKSR